jgi:arabinose-5-phosphate isomerase
MYLKSPKALIVTGVGKSLDIAKLFVSMLVSIDINARTLHPTDAVHGELGSVPKNSPVIIISNGGKSPELLELAFFLQLKKCKIVTITSNSDSPLIKKSDLTLLLPKIKELNKLKHPPVTSSVIYLSLLQQLVSLSLELRNYSMDKYAHNHPGGGIGKKIFIKVKDVMLNKTSLPIAKLSDKFLDIVSSITEYSKGVLLVFHRRKFEGIISEKDVRLVIQGHKEKAFSLRASDIMNVNPRVLFDTMLAIEAAEYLLSFDPPLNFAPVKNKNDKIVGVVRLSDLISSGLK